jgi:hypothetical protein
MKKIMIFLMVGMLSLSLHSQHVFNKGDLLFNAGIGGLSSDGWIPSVNVSGEYGVIPTGDIGLVSFGGIMAYKYSSWSGSYYTTNYDYHYSQFTIGPRATWHVHAFESDKWDAYGGVGAGMRFWTQYQWDQGTLNYVNKAKVSPYGEVYVGGRMMFSESFGLFAEVGYGTLSAIKFGVTFGF